MEVEIGKEGLKFENGAFTYYGVSALTAPSSGKLGTPLVAGGGGGWALWGLPRPLLQGGLPGDLLALTVSWLCGGRAGFLQASSLLFFPPLPNLSPEERICPPVRSAGLHSLAGVISRVALRGWAGPGRSPVDS